MRNLFAALIATIILGTTIAPAQSGMDPKSNFNGYVHLDTSQVMSGDDARLEQILLLDNYAAYEIAVEWRDEDGHVLWIENPAP